MLDLNKILLDGLVLSIIGGSSILGIMRYSLRMLLNKGDFPADILAVVAPKTREEKPLALILAIPFLFAIVALPFISTRQFQQQSGSEAEFFLLFLHAFAILMIFSLFDLLILDFLLFCTITPRFMAVAGTEGLAGYKDFAFHVRQHASGR